MIPKGMNKPHLMDNGSSVMMPTKMYVKEHKKLIKILDGCGAKKEAKSQAKELKNVLMKPSMAKNMRPGIGEIYGA
jgi:hypothetical protein